MNDLEKSIVPRGTIQKEVPSIESEFLRLRKEAEKKLGISLEKIPADLFSIHFQEMVRFNRAVNLTRITDVQSALTKHYMDSLAGLPFLEGERYTVLDVGSGAGFPGLALAACLPDINMQLLESSTKRVEFLKHAIRCMGLTNVDVIRGKWPETVEGKRFHRIISRAVFSSMDEWRCAGNFLEENGRLILWKGRESETALSGLIQSSHFYTLPEQKENRLLSIYEKGITTLSQKDRKWKTP